MMIKVKCLEKFMLAKRIMTWTVKNMSRHCYTGVNLNPSCHCSKYVHLKCFSIAVAAVQMHHYSILNASLRLVQTPTEINGVLLGCMGSGYLVHIARVGPVSVPH